MKELHFVMTQPPSPESQFVELEDENGKSLNGTWTQRADGNWELIIKPVGAFRERSDVLAFQQKFGVPMASEPSFLDRDTLMYRVKFLVEELHEFVVANALPFEVRLSPLSALQADALAPADLKEAADALVDLSYVLHGTALMMGLPWPRLWDEVQRANMAKVRASHEGESKRGSALDVVKPAGWTAPDHTAAVGSGPWPTFKIQSLS